MGRLPRRPACFIRCKSWQVADGQLLMADGCVRPLGKAFRPFLENSKKEGRWVAYSGVRMVHFVRNRSFIFFISNKNRWLLKNLMDKISLGFANGNFSGNKIAFWLKFIVGRKIQGVVYFLNPFGWLPSF